MESELRDAISRDEFELHYQPVVDARTRRICGVEAFVRWHHPSRGLLAPDQFLPLAESTGLMLPLGEWILQQACMDAAAWPPHIRIAVNISAVQFSKGNLFDLILCALVDSGLSPERLELEIADTSLLEKDQAAHLQTIRQLKNLGVSIVLDNCGAGYSVGELPDELSIRQDQDRQVGDAGVCQPPGLRGGRCFRAGAGARPRYRDGRQGNREQRRSSRPCRPRASILRRVICSADRFRIPNSTSMLP